MRDTIKTELILLSRTSSLMLYLVRKTLPVPKVNDGQAQGCLGDLYLIDSPVLVSFIKPKPRLSSFHGPLFTQKFPFSLFLQLHSMLKSPLLLPRRWAAAVADPSRLGRSVSSSRPACNFQPSVLLWLLQVLLKPPDPGHPVRYCGACNASPSTSSTSIHTAG